MTDTLDHFMEMPFKNIMLLFKVAFIVYKKYTINKKYCMRSRVNPLLPVHVKTLVVILLKKSSKGVNTGECLEKSIDVRWIHVRCIYEKLERLIYRLL